MKPFLRLLPAFMLAATAVYFTMASCASISSPTGGPKDTIAPKLDTSFPPNYSTQFEAIKVTLVFDEYISLKSASQQISISPPLKEKPTILSSGREVSIKWNDTLLDNTTYIISFGSSITDFNEGNVNDKFKYVFSTGDFIDSLELRGYVYDKTGTGAKDIMVALYDWQTLKVSDSIPYKNLPTYYAYTDENGKFELTNIKYSKFHVVAFQDIRQNFKLNSGTEPIAFSNDTLITGLENEPLELQLFLPEGAKRFYGARHEGFGQIQLAYSYPIPALRVKTLPENDSVAIYTELNQTKDTATILFNPTEFQDSVVLLTLDSTYTIDTSSVIFKDFDKEKFTPKLAKTSIRKTDPIIIVCPKPIEKTDTSLISLYSGQDTIGFQLLDSSYVKGNLMIIPEKYPKEFTLKVATSAIEVLGSIANDSIAISLTSLARDELGNLEFIVKADSTTYPLILKIFNETGGLIHQSSFYKNTSVSFKNQIPGKYKAELILDEDGNAKWSTGNYIRGTQPERILYYTEEIEVRANWDLELEWQVDLKE